MIVPPSPPRINAARESSRRPPLVFLGPWHLWQCSANIGRIFDSKRASSLTMVDCAHAERCVIMTVSNPISMRITLSSGTEAEFYSTNSLADAPQVLEAANQNVAARDHERRVHMLIDAVGGQQLELLRIGGDDKGVAATVADVEPAVGVHHRSPGAAAGTFLECPHWLAGRQLEALRRTAFGENVDVFADDDARADALRVGLGVMPEPVLGDVARAAELDRQRRAAKAGKLHGNVIPFRCVGEQRR